MSLTPLRPLTEAERAAHAKLLADAANPVTLAETLRELIVAREIIRTTRSYKRCQPPPVLNALDGYPHLPRPTAVEYRHD
jgi:hypothetical protein